MYVVHFYYFFFFFLKNMCWHVVLYWVLIFLGVVYFRISDIYLNLLDASSGTFIQIPLVKLFVYAGMPRS